jgi:type II secretory pathway component PulJ
MKPTSWRTNAFSLVELAICLVIVSLITLAVSHMLITNTTAQLKQNLHTNHVGTLSTVVSQIRNDMQRSVTATLGGGGNTLTFLLDGGLNVVYIYDPVAFTITRNEGAGPLVDYRNLMPQQLQATTRIRCNNPCFVLQGTTQVSISNLEIADASPTTDAFDATFGQAGFRIPELLVNKMAGYTFR